MKMELHAVSILSLLVCIDGAVYMTTPIRISANGIPLEPYCKYRKFNVLPGSYITDYDTCETCSCSENGLRCETKTYYKVPESSQCVSVHVACKLRWVMRNDKTKECPQDLIPTDVWEVGR